MKKYKNPDLKIEAIVNGIIDDIYKNDYTGNGWQGIIEELDRYVAEYPMEPDYGYVADGNLLYWDDDICEFMCIYGIKVRLDTDIALFFYKCATGIAICHIRRNRECFLAW